MSLLLRGAGVLFILYIAYTANPGSSLFSFHPLLMTIAFTGLMTEGLFMFSKSGLAAEKLHSTQVTAHWAVILAASVAHGLGYAAIYFTKEQNNKPHLTSWHGTLGLAVSVLLWLQLSAGVLVKYPKILKGFISLKIIKTYHGLFGTLTYATGMLTMLLGLWSGWFQNNASIYIFYSAILLHLFLLFIMCKKIIKNFGIVTK